MENYSHWRNMQDNDHLRAEMFQPGEEKVLTIKEVKKETVTSNSGEVESKPVAYFIEPGVLPMVLNVTNCKIIEKLYGTGNVYDWVGKKIQVFATSTRVAKETVPCLRIRNFVPQTNEVTYKCSVCGTNITKDIHDKSIAKYGKAYCSGKCYETDKNGKTLL